MSSENPSSSVASTTQPATPSRADLVTRAKEFLTSPQVQYETMAAKRQFLTEKGLTEAEIIQLLQEVPPHIPSIPPRTYPSVPPSELPVLLAGLFRVMRWIAGGSLTLLLIYYRFIMPRLTDTFMARHSLKNHQRALLTQLTVSLETTRKMQKDGLADLPRAEPIQENAACMKYQSLSQLTGLDNIATEKVPPFTVLRCTLADFAARGKQPTSDELFQELTSKLSWIASDPSYNDQIWTTLTMDSKYFVADASDPQSVRWSYKSPTPMTHSPIVEPLEKLRRAVPQPDFPPSSGRFQHTLQTMIDLTGYLTSQVYAVPSSTFNHRAPGAPVVALNPQEEEVRKEIRALKGLVLNRRTFMPSRPPSTPLSNQQV